MLSINVYLVLPQDIVVVLIVVVINVVIFVVDFSLLMLFLYSVVVNKSSRLPLSLCGWGG